MPRPVHLPLLGLVLLAGMHALLVATAGLSPWLGAGFGMFSTIDERHLIAVHVGGPRSGEEIALPEWLDEPRLRARALPTRGRLEALAREIGAETAGCEAVRVEVWRSRYDPDTLRPAGERLATAEAPCPAA